MSERDKYPDPCASGVVYGPRREVPWNRRDDAEREAAAVAADREQRIRQVAAHVMTESWKLDAGVPIELLAKSSLKRATKIIDALDRLPVPEKQP